MNKVLIIGGYGNFGSFIARMLAREENIQLVLAGRDVEKAKKFASELNAKKTPECFAIM